MLNVITCKWKKLNARQVAKPSLAVAYRDIKVFTEQNCCMYNKGIYIIINNNNNINSINAYSDKKCWDQQKQPVCSDETHWKQMGDELCCSILPLRFWLPSRIESQKNWGTPRAKVKSSSLVFSRCYYPKQHGCAIRVWESSQSYLVVRQSSVVTDAAPRCRALQSPPHRSAQTGSEIEASH